MLSISLGAALGGAAAEAHHAISAVYDSSKRVSVEGVIARVQFVNPHPLVIIDVTDSRGTRAGANAEQWLLEMDNRWELVEVGFTEETLRPGDRVTVTGSLSRTQPRRIYLLQLDRPADGFRYEQVGSRPRIALRPER
jgi:hypothetical protein